MTILATRTIETETGMTVDIQHNDGRDGPAPVLVYMVIDGQCFAFTKSDAARIGEQLQAFAREMRTEAVMGAFVGPEIPSAQALGIFPPGVVSVTPGAVYDITLPHMHVGYVDSCLICRASRDSSVEGGAGGSGGQVGGTGPTQKAIK